MCIPIRDHLGDLTSSRIDHPLVQIRMETSSKKLKFYSAFVVPDVNSEPTHKDYDECISRGKKV